MKAKAVKKILMRHRSRVLWGSRAFITVRFPLSLIPEPLPPRANEEHNLGISMGLEGYWKRQEEENTVLTVIAQISSGRDPSDRKSETPVYHLRETDYGYEWWEIEERVFKGGLDVEPYRVNLIAVRPGPEAVMNAYRARKLWREKYLQGHEGETGIPVLDGFLGAANWAKTTYQHVDEKNGQVFITYSVKWFYPNRKLRFSSDLARAMRAAKAAGVPARIVG